MHYPLFLKVTAPTTVEGIEKYLGSGMIGPREAATAERLAVESSNA